MGMLQGGRSIVPPAAPTRASIASTSATRMYGTIPGKPTGILERKATVGPAGATMPVNSADIGWGCQPNSLA
jgi:hypothetical protein